MEHEIKVFRRLSFYDFGEDKICNRFFVELNLIILPIQKGYNTFIFTDETPRRFYNKKKKIRQEIGGETQHFGEGKICNFILFALTLLYFDVV